MANCRAWPLKEGAATRVIAPVELPLLPLVPVSYADCQLPSVWIPLTATAVVGTIDRAPELPLPEPELPLVELPELLLPDVELLPLPPESPDPLPVELLLPLVGVPELPLAAVDPGLPLAELPVPLLSVVVPDEVKDLPALARVEMLLQPLARVRTTTAARDKIAL